MSIRSSTLFVSREVVAFKVPPGEVVSSNWSPPYIWQGGLRVVEEERLPDIVDHYAHTGGGAAIDEMVKPPEKPFFAMRLKLELFNRLSVDKPPVIWAEVWYNPLDTSAYNCVIANNGEDTVQLASDSPQHLKVFAQFPGSGYKPVDDQSDHITVDRPIQVALGLQFKEPEDSWRFLEVLDRYHTRYSALIESYNYEIRLLNIERDMQNGIEKLSIKERETPGKIMNQAEQDEQEEQIQKELYLDKQIHDDNDDNDDDDDDEDDDEFGDFVEV
ncbi:hypothetical protein CAAN1_05S00694 [[Candida] anglica]|uniref:Uncharacterized protein n=1 Tax=[Candida] anglica TaxID=148631 RepID=A0ABP0ECL0_9ASCO